MKSELVSFKLKDIAKFSYGKMPKKDKLNTGGYPTFSGYKYQHTYPETNCKKNDIIVVARGVGGSGDVKIVKEDCYLTNLSIKIELDSSLIDSKYFYYNYLHKTLRYLDSGSAQSQITINDLSSVLITIPSLQTQKKIADILSILDDKIELNKKINQTLESIAQAMFKSWFVDFDPVHAKANAKSDDEYDAIAKELGISREILDLFPSEFEESELGLIPKGWSIVSFTSLANMKTKSVKPFEYPDKAWTSYSIPAFDSNRYPEMCLGSEIKSNKYKVESGAILVSKLNPNTPRVWLVNSKIDDAICSTEFMQFVPNHIENRAYNYCLINSDYFQNEIKCRVTGTTGSRQRAQPKEVAVIPVLNPTSDLINEFSKLTISFLQKTLIAREEINSLKNIQKLLLPKLLTGEIDVSNLNLEPEND